MAKRDIERALKKKGVVAERIEWVWSAAPGEMVPCWEVHLSDADADKFGEDHLLVFDSTEDAVDWASSLTLYEEDE